MSFGVSIGVLVPGSFAHMSIGTRFVYSSIDIHVTASYIMI